MTPQTGFEAMTRSSAMFEPPTAMTLHVLAYNLKRVMNILGIGSLIAAMRAA